MKPVFADTSYYVALVCPDDARHVVVRRWSQANTRPIVTTGFVLIELGNILSRAFSRRVFVELAAHLRRDPKVSLIPVSEELSAAGFNLYAERPDKEWSLTDCISFVVMRRLGITDALTADRHFEQAGFNALLR